jgi:hypothetical protein
MFSGQIKGVDPALPLLPPLRSRSDVTSPILSAGIMEVDDGKEGEATEESDDQRRCRRFTMAPSLPTVEVVTMEDASKDDSEADSNSGQGEFYEF